MKVSLACTMRARLVGLMGKPHFDGILLLAPCHDIHTFGMGHDLDIAFVSADGSVVEAHRNVRPNRRLRNRRAIATLERLACDEPWYAPGDRLHWQWP